MKPEPSEETATTVHVTNQTSSMNISIGQDFINAGTKVTLGVITAAITVAPSSDALNQQLETVIAARLAELGEGPASVVPQIAATRKAYKAFGKDPARYRPAAEALTRRVLQGKGLYRINNVVEVNNLVSIKTGVSIGAYDLAAIDGAVEFRRGRDNEPYVGIGRGPLNIEGLPVFADAQGPFGSPTSDSERTMVTENCTRLLMLLVGFGDAPEIEAAMSETTELLERFCGATDLHRSIVRN